jgi:hypothetical protein
VSDIWEKWVRQKHDIESIKKIISPDVKEISYSRFYDFSGSDTQISEEDLSKKIFVFNEDYIRNKVSFREDGLGTIAMFGKQVELETLIDKAEADFKDAQKALEIAFNNVAPYNDPNSVSSPEYYLNKMSKALSGDDHWNPKCLRSMA